MYFLQTDAGEIHDNEIRLNPVGSARQWAAAGDAVTKGQLIGAVGNSGYSDEPHLHVQANTVDGRPVAIVFDGRFLAINDIHRN